MIKEARRTAEVCAMINVERQASTLILFLKKIRP
jgi:hypothetical protein